VAFKLAFGPNAVAVMSRLRADQAQAKRLKAVEKALGLMQVSLRHQALNTHKYEGTKCPHKMDLFEAYAENSTPGAYRIFFCYDPDLRETLLIVDVCAHP
jgi:hypothetical protein